MNKRIISMFMVLISIVALTACGPSRAVKNTTIDIASMKGPTSIGLAKLYNDSDNKKSTCNYNYTICGTADEITAGLLKGDYDIAALPCNVAATLYHKSEGDIVIAGINTLGALYVVEKGYYIGSFADLKNTWVYSTGQGTTPEYTFNYLLTMNDITPVQDITVIYTNEASELVSTIETQHEIITVLPEPYVTLAVNKHPELRVALDFSKEWERVNPGSAMITGVIVARKDFAKNNPEVMEEFLKEYDASVNFANSNTEDCAEILEGLDIMKADIAKKAIPNCNVVLITGNEMETKVTSYLNVLYEANPDSVGGNPPVEEMFYK